MTVDGALELVNVGVNTFTAVEVVAAKACPPKLNTIWPLLEAEPLLNVTEGVLVALSGAVKNCR